MMNGETRHYCVELPQIGQNQRQVVLENLDTGIIGESPSRRFEHGRPKIQSDTTSLGSGQFH